jgi:capsular polysaccharide transport system permease protein
MKLAKLPLTGSLNLASLAQALTKVGSGNRPQARSSGDAVTVGPGTPLIPTIYDRLNRRRVRRRILAALFVVLPTFVATVYFGLIASDRYVSETSLVVSSGAGNTPSVTSLLSLVGMGQGGDDNQQRAMLYEYLLSTEAMNQLDRKIGLRAMWSRSEIDPFSRLRSDASQEEFNNYYRSHVHVVADPTQPVIAVNVQAFRPEEATLVARTLLQLGEETVNKAFDQSRADSLNFARDEVAGAEGRVAAIDEKLTDFRREHSELDPAAAATTVGTVAGTLFGQLSSAEAELHATRSYLSEDATQVKLLRTRIEALKNQIAADRGLLVGGKDTTTYVDLLAKYQNLLMEQKFAETAYTAALAFLATTRADAVRQHSYVIDFVPPSLPQEATEPHRVRDIVLVFFVSLLVYVIGTLVVSALREHAHL